jgi:4-aminobutyrate aminotransferase-like enzyme
LKQQVSIIGDVRGRGLMIGIDSSIHGPKDIMGVPLYDGDIAARVQKSVSRRS